ncbi:MAG TPA: Flp family type IVb pilin [Gaiellaceae bacterium]|jgi:Flp pilus assembly pilin Flp
MQTLSQKLLARLVTTLDREDGQTMAEYGVILAVITVAIITVLTLLSNTIRDTLNNVVTAM